MHVSGGDRDPTVPCNAGERPDVTSRSAKTSQERMSKARGQTGAPSRVSALRRLKAELCSHQTYIGHLLFDSPRSSVAVDVDIKISPHLSSPKIRTRK